MSMNKIEIFTYTAMVFIAISLAACTKDNDTVPASGGSEINAAFITDDARTRVNTLDDSNDRGGLWDDGDKISVSVAKEDEMGDEAVFTLSNSEGMDVWSRDRSFCWADQNSAHTIWAAYPSEYDAFSYELPSEQETETKLKKADYINGLWHGKPAVYVSIPMKHRMALVTVTYVLGSSDFEDNTIPTKAEVFSKNSQAAFDTDGTMTGLSGGEKWVTACLHDGNKFSAIVTPGQYKRGEEFLKLTVNGKEYRIAMKMDTEFQEGHKCTYNLNIGKNKAWVTVLNCEKLPGWTQEENLQSQSGTIGTPDEGKTSWKEGDELLVMMQSQLYGKQYAAFRYDGSDWKLASGELYYREEQVPVGCVSYAPDYMWSSSGITPELKDGNVAGTGEYITTSAYSRTGYDLNAYFSSVQRDYSRLRMSMEPNTNVTVIVSKFTPANGSGAVNSSYSLTSDANGNVFLYGNFAAGASVAVKSGEASLAQYTFTTATENGKSYALDATGRR